MPFRAERREFIRIPFQAEVQVRTGGRTITAPEGIDISMNGLRIPDDGPPLPEGIPCAVRMALGAEEPIVIEATGAVARSGGGIIAVRFTGVDVESFEHLERLIVLNAGRPDEAERELRKHWGIYPQKR